jgi:diguanylate cyclase (GGDEF)-like protein/PAS domain S-box-containing protein
MSSHSRHGLILIVDDHDSIRDILGRNLRLQGHRILMASHGIAALDLVAQHPIELILLDVNMPEMNGIEVLTQLKSNPATNDIPVLMLSAESDIDQIITCINLGAEDYLVKPFNSVFLKARVTSCLEKHRLRLQQRAYQQTLEDRVAERTALAEQHAKQLENQTAILESILNSMGDGVVVVDTQGTLVHLNPAAQTILGSHLGDFLPMQANRPSVFRAFDQKSRYALSELPLTQAVLGHETDNLELCITTETDLASQWLSVTARPLRHQEGNLIGGVAVLRDVSATKSAEVALRESEERFALAARGANDGLWDWDLRLNQIYFSPRWKAMLGFEEHEIGQSLDEWMRRVHPDDRERLEVRLAAHHHRLITHFEHEYRIMHRDGSYRWMLCRGLAVWGEAGQAIRMAGSQTDITDRKSIERQLLHDALHDGLTNLPNRVLFLDRLETALNRFRRHPSAQFAVMFLDLDRFKTINDSLGHVTGDKLLKIIAKRLEGCVRPGDTVARLGGDEFTLLLYDVNDELVARTIADRIQETVSMPIQLGDQEVFTAASIGILLSDSQYHSATDIIRDADTAMYHAKISGKARAVLFDSAMHAQAMLQLQIESDLRWAIERDELRVHYQPIVELSTQEIVGVEALVRWQHPEHGLLYPNRFLSIAEEMGLISPLSWHILAKACAQIRTWQQEIPGAENMWVSVNLSAKQLSEPDLVTRIQAILQELELNPRLLKLEITEHALIEHGEVTIQALNQLRELGVQLCIDDFGIGYSSLSYLQRFPIDILKIDRSFISQIGEPGKRNEVVQTIIGLAQTLGMRAVAEGTETQIQADILNLLSCDFGQGWLFSKALDPTALVELLTEKVH